MYICTYVCIYVCIQGVSEFQVQPKFDSESGLNQTEKKVMYHFAQIAVVIELLTKLWGQMSAREAIGWTLIVITDFEKRTVNIV